MGSLYDNFRYWNRYDKEWDEGDGLRDKECSNLSNIYKEEMILRDSDNYKKDDIPYSTVEFIRYNKRLSYSYSRDKGEEMD